MEDFALPPLAPKAELSAKQRAARLSLLMAALASSSAYTHPAEASAIVCGEQFPCYGGGYGGNLVIAPEQPVVAQGTQAVVDVGFTGLFNNLIGSYDITVGWDPNLLSFSDLAFLSFLDGPVNSVQGFASNTGSLEVFEVSLGDLVNQTGFGSVPLFKITFDSLAGGTSPLIFVKDAPTGLVVGDELGVEYTNFVTFNSSIDITPVVLPPPTSVPEPDSLLLLAGGLLLCLQWRRLKWLKFSLENELATPGKA